MTTKNIVIYSQNNCPFGDIMKEMLDTIGYNYDIINVKENFEALEFMVSRGHKKVPQLYANNIHINKKANTKEYTPLELKQLIDEAVKKDWMWIDSGIEQGHH